MKKFLAILVCVCLLAVSSFSCFAVTDLANVKAVIDDDEMYEEVEATVYDQAMDIIYIIQLQGEVTNEEILDVADNLYNEAYIDEDVYNEIYRIVESGILDEDDDTTVPDENEELINEIVEILTDSELSMPEKIAKVANILKVLPSDEVETILNDLNAAGIIDDDTYSAISDAINGENSILGGSDTEDGSPISGIKDLLSGILGMLGIGGDSDDSDDSDVGGNNSSSASESTSTDATNNPDSSNFEGSSTKTGDYALISVAGVALAAGIALVLTKVKKNENDE